MAFNPQQINPVDLNPNIAVGVNLPFNGSAVFTSNYQTKDSIKNNLINFFLTNPGERPLNPTFGGGLRAFIFEQIEEDNLNGLKENINFQLENVFPNIIVSSLNILKNNDNNSITVQLKYSVANSNINDNLTLQL
jgi:phage baseplate assembly protein W